MNPNYGVQNVQNQKINENQRNIMKLANQQQKIIQNPVQHKHVFQNPNPKTNNNMQPSGNYRKTYNPTQLKPNLQFENEIIEETYVIDQQTGQKIILETKAKPKANNNQIHNKTNPQKNLHTGKPTQVVKKENNTINNNEITDLTLTIDPTLAQNNNSKHITYTDPIIENINQTIFVPNGNIGGEQNNDSHEANLKKSATLMTVSSLANLPYEEYPNVEFSKQTFMNISGYGFNSYNGKVKKYNEDRIKVIPQFQKNFKNKNINISYFSIFDGHSGNKCSDFLRENLDKYLFNSTYFPHNLPKAIKESFNKAEETFKSMAYDQKSNVLKDKSGSCALVMLIIDKYLFSINLGDSRALYSYDSGKYLYQITRDHKPNDEIEKKRIENAGGKVFYANKVKRNGKEIELKEENFGKGFSFPYRILPGKIAVRFILYLIF